MPAMRDAVGGHDTETYAKKTTAATDSPNFYWA